MHVTQVRSQSDHNDELEAGHTNSRWHFHRLRVEGHLQQPGGLDGGGPNGRLQWASGTALVSCNGGQGRKAKPLTIE